MVPALRAIRRAFTLIELLIVIAVIMVLVGLLIPAASMVRTQAYTVKCMHNMQQIASVIEVYVQNDNGTYPGNFSELVAIYTLPTKILLCPLDPSHGADPNMGRALPSSSWQDYSRLYNMQHVLTSYDFECSGNPDPNVCMANDIDFFYRDWKVSGKTLPTAGTVSWADCKAHEQQYGNLDPTTGQPGAPFPASCIPIIRCYHHWDWNHAEALAHGGNDYPAKVNNICLDFNQAWTTPYWEVQYNPAILSYLWPP